MSTFNIFFHRWSEIGGNFPFFQRLCLYGYVDSTTLDFVDLNSFPGRTNLNDKKKSRPFISPLPENVQSLHDLFKLKTALEDVTQSDIDPMGAIVSLGAAVQHDVVSVGIWHSSQSLDWGVCSADDEGS